jgi:hypothetical protein
MTHLLLSAVLLAASFQNQPFRVGEIEFFGYAGVDLAKVQAALPLHEGDDLDMGKWEQEKARVRQSVRRATGSDSTDVAATCCDARGELIIYIGLSGKPVRYLPAPAGGARLPKKVIRLYDRTDSLLKEALRKGVSAEDRSKGFSLSDYPPLRAVQLELRAYAVGHERLLRDVLATSSDGKQRAVAAEVLGYGRRTRAQVAALAAASRDLDEGVRNNATRALVVLAAADSKRVRRIHPDGFIGMLLSGTWTDLNKAGALLADLTRGREPALLAKLRRPEVLERLVEMARWRTVHAEPARYILGRVAGIEENRLGRLVAEKRVDAIISALRAN